MMKYAVRIIVILAAVTAGVMLFWLLWDPYPATEARFDRESNGIWIGHRVETARKI